MTEIFVFGSNLRGVHGAGSAKEAVLHWGAKPGHSVGRSGDSYAIPTKDKALRVLPVKAIARYVDDFIVYAMIHSKLTFNVVAIGCGLAGYKPATIAPLFAFAPKNVKLPPEFEEVFKK